MHVHRFTILVLLAASSATGSIRANETARPNVVLIISDDQAWTDYGFMSHPDIQTPKLDRLARQSLVFERGYVAAPLCRPSLATMVTGLYPFQLAVEQRTFSRVRVLDKDANQTYLVQLSYELLKKRPDLCAAFL